MKIRRIIPSLTILNGDLVKTQIFDQINCNYIGDLLNAVRIFNDKEAEATFKAMIHAVDPLIIKDENVKNEAVWLIDGYTPTNTARGVFSAVEMKTKPYPMLPYIGLMHSAIGAEIADFMQNKEDAKKTLSDIEDAYRAAAKEKGFL